MINKILGPWEPCVKTCTSHQAQIMFNLSFIFLLNLEGDVCSCCQIIVSKSVCGSVDNIDLYFLFGHFQN